MPCLCLVAQKMPCRVSCVGCPAGRVLSPVHRLFGGKEKACPVCNRAGSCAIWGSVRGIVDCGERQDCFAKFITVKR